MDEKEVMSQIKEIRDYNPLTTEKLENISKKWEEHDKIRFIGLKNNKDEYWKHREELMKTYNGKYIAYSNGKVVGVSDTFDGTSDCYENDPSVFTTLVGNEKYKPSTDDVLMGKHTIRGMGLDSAKNSSKTCFPYHEKEQQVVRETDFDLRSGWCGHNRIYVSLLLKK
jgi:hypothetical protein